MTFLNKVGRGLIWTVVEKFGQQALLFVSFVIVVRIIGPLEFGIFSIAQIVPSIISMLMIGMADGVISKRLRNNDDISTIFWTIVTFGGFTTLAMFLSAGAIATLLAQPQVENILIWMSALPILSAVSTVPTLIIQSRMDFGFFAARSLLSSAIGGIVGILAAVAGYGALAIVLQMIVQQSVIALIVWFGARWKPIFAIKLRTIPALMAPGFNISASYILEILEQTMPRVMIGFFGGPVLVGYYSLLTRLWQSIRDIAILPVSTVFFPAIVRLSDKDRNLLPQVLRGVFLLLGFLTFPILAGICLISPEAVPLIFGESWTPAIQMLQIYLIGCSFMPFWIVFRTVARVDNKMNSVFTHQLLFLVGGLLAFFISLQHSIELAVGAGALMNLFMVTSAMFRAKNILGLDFLEFGKSAAIPLTLTVVMVASVLLLKSFTQIFIDGWLSIVITTIFGTAVYLILALLVGLHRSSIIREALAVLRGHTDA